MVKNVPKWGKFEVKKNPEASGTYSLILKILEHMISFYSVMLTLTQILMLPADSKSHLRSYCFVNGAAITDILRRSSGPNRLFQSNCDRTTNL